MKPRKHAASERENDMQNALSRLVSYAIAIVVGLGFVLGGAFLIYNEYRLAKEREQLVASGVETVATVTGNEIETVVSDGHVDSYYAITYSFSDQAGTIWSGWTQPYTDSETWFETPTPGESILDADMVEGDRILVIYLPDNPDINRTIEECRNCADLGSFGDNLATYVGMFFMLLGASFLYVLLRRGLVRSA